MRRKADHFLLRAEAAVKLAAAATHELDRRRYLERAAQWREMARRAIGREDAEPG